MLKLTMVAHEPKHSRPLGSAGHRRTESCATTKEDFSKQTGLL